ncbi:MAG: hypothetical protein AB7P04_14555 [Bacteriovoracia bacterium]
MHVSLSSKQGFSVVALLATMALTIILFESSLAGLLNSAHLSQAIFLRDLLRDSTDQAGALLATPEFCKKLLENVHWDATDVGVPQAIQPNVALIPAPVAATFRIDSVVPGAGNATALGTLILALQGQGVSSAKSEVKLTATINTLPTGTELLSCRAASNGNLTNFQCPAGQILAGIQAGQGICRPIETSQLAGLTRVCTARQFVRGFTSEGEPVCEDFPAPI